MSLRLRPGPRLAAAGLVLGVLIVFVAANAHLVAVSFASRPDCALSDVTTGGAAAYRPATSAC